MMWPQVKSESDMATNTELYIIW